MLELDDVTDIESGVSAAFLTDGIVYALLAGGALLQLLRNCSAYRPWTIQKMIHLLMFGATFVRSIFLLLVGLDWCDVLTGEVKTSTCSALERDLFYVLDQLPILLFFAIYALLVQFWAEVYCNAVDALGSLEGIIKPTIRWGIACVFVLQGLYWSLYATKWRSERSFFAKGQANANMLLFLLVSAGLVIYSRRAYRELRLVPVEVGVRSHKMRELTWMTTICCTCFLARSVIQMVLSRKHAQLHGHGTWFVIVVYYALLEIVPSISVLYFNRRFPQRHIRVAASGPIPLDGEDDEAGATYYKVYDKDADGTDQDSLRESLLRSSSN